MNKIIFFMSLIFFCSCGRNSNKEIKIGSQIWSNNNLNVDCFQNGDKIVEAKTEDDWIEANSKNIPAWCYYENDDQFNNSIGKIYNFAAISDSRKLAPKGWKIPSKEDFEKLIENSGGAYDASKRLKAEDEWDEEGCSDKYGFSAAPTGFRMPNGSYDGRKSFNNNMQMFANSCNLWSTTDTISHLNDHMIYCLQIDKNQDELTCAIKYNGWGYYVRCIKEK